MNIEDILSEIDAEIARLQQAKVLLGSSAPVAATGKRKPGRPPSSAKTAAPVYGVKTVVKRRKMSAEGRAKIAAAQKARWAKTKRAAKAAGKKKPGRPAKAAGKKLSPKKSSVARTETPATAA